MDRGFVIETIALLLLAPCFLDCRLSILLTCCCGSHCTCLCFLSVSVCANLVLSGWGSQGRGQRALSKTKLQRSVCSLLTGTERGGIKSVVALTPVWISLIDAARVTFHQLVNYGHLHFSFITSFLFFLHSPIHFLRSYITQACSLSPTVLFLFVFRLHVCNTFFLFLSGDSHVGQRRDGGREVVFEHGRSAAGARQVKDGLGERGKKRESFIVTKDANMI